MMVLVEYGFWAVYLSGFFMGVFCMGLMWYLYKGEQP